MTALRMTRPDTDRQPPPRARGRWRDSVRVLAVVGGAALAGLTGLTGCGSGHDGPANAGGAHPKPVEQLTAGPLLPAPDPDRIEYNAETRTLTFYELPESGRWMIQRPGDPYPVPTGPEHRVPAGMDPNHVHIGYARPGGQQSRTVTLRAIQEGRTIHTSFGPPAP